MSIAVTYLGMRPTMTATNIKVREHYSAAGLTDRIKAALATVTPESEALTVAQLNPLDQFHTRGILRLRENTKPRGSISPVIGRETSKN